MLWPMKRLRKDRPLAAKNGSEENLRTGAVVFGGQKWLGRKFTDGCSNVILRFRACLPIGPFTMSRKPDTSRTWITCKTFLYSSNIQFWNGKFFFNFWNFTTSWRDVKSCDPCRVVFRWEGWFVSNGYYNWDAKRWTPNMVDFLRWKNFNFWFRMNFSVNISTENGFFLFIFCTKFPHHIDSFNRCSL